MFSSMAVMKAEAAVAVELDEVVAGMLDHLKLDVLMIDPHELTAVILELVSNDKVLGEMGPDKLIPWVVPP